MAEKTNVPEIRFAGFTDPWEQRKFADFVSASGIRNSENLELPSYSVTNDCGFVPQDERFENGGTMREADKTSYWIVEPKSFAYNPARINVGSIGYQSTSGNVIVSSLYEVFQTDETCDDRFLWHWFKTRLFTQQIEMLQEGGVRLYFFFDKLLKSGISMPSVDEQRLIGEQFDWLDSLITLHQRKYDKLAQLKKSMLDKMFPKPGERFPEIRFAGFTDPWEQRKLGEVALVTMGQSPNGACYTDNPNDAVLVQGNADLKDGWVSPRVWTTEVTKTAKAGDLIMSVRAPVGAMGKTAYDVVLGRGVAGIAGNEFLFQALSKKEAEGYWSTVSAGSTFDSINGDELRNTPVNCPRSELECETIGDCLSKVDSLITLHQRKLELLRNTKKSLLDRMFV